MSTFAWIGLGLALLVIAAIAEAALKKGRSRPLAAVQPTKLDDGTVTSQMGMEATDLRAVNETIRSNRRAAQTTSVLTQGTNALRRQRSVKK